MQRADGVTDGALRVLARLFHRLNAGLKIPHIVERVKNAEHVHSIGGSLLHKALHDSIFIVTVSQQVLAAKQHLQPALRKQFAEHTQPFPWILIQEANAGIESCASPAFHRPVAGIVDVFAGRDHVIHRHPGGEQTLVSISERKFGNLNHARHL